MASSCPPAPSERVFNTTELLEHILLLCTDLTVLRAHRINHHFKNVIAGSLDLQQKLHLQADWTAPDHGSTLTSLFFGNRSRPRQPEITICASHGREVAIRHFRMPRAGNCVDMFLHQPPKTEVKTWIRRSQRSREGMTFKVVTNAEGVRWGDICEAWEDQVRDDKLCVEIVRGARTAREREARG